MGMEKINQFMELAKDLKIKGLEPTSEPSRDTVESDSSRSYIDSSTTGNDASSIFKSDEVAIQFPCHLCGHIAESRKFMKDHIEANHTLNYPRFLCDYSCEKNTALRNHIQQAHVNGAYSCNKCEYFTGSKDSLSEHFGNSHVDI